MTGQFTEPADCGEIKFALGVYVVGAIDPAERAVVDAHLARCPDCREELAGLAGLPALLGRVPTADAERLALGEEVLEEPPAQLLDSLLAQVSGRRRARRLRFVAAAAAAAVIAVAAGLIAGSLVSHSAAPAAAMERGSNPANHVAATVFYTPEASGTKMQVQVTGIPPGEPCVFWVITRGGQHVSDGQWMSGPATEWYAASTHYRVSQLQGVDISVNGKVQVRVPVS
jgi:anti-sigma factor RsiW